MSLLFLLGCTHDQGSACDTPDHQPDAGTVAPLLSCGDGTCQVGETLDNCPHDCFVCGDGTCTDPETVVTCPQDCTLCGDGVCTGGETAESCDDDCTVCGDHQCTGGETVATCSQDCGATLIFENLSTTTLYFAYVWKCGTTDKGSDLLGASVLSPNYHVEFDNVQAGCWNLEVDASTGAYYAGQTNVMLAAGSTYTWMIH